MRISKKCYYALRATFELARRPTDVPVTVAQIANAQGIPARFLESILNELRRAGLVQSQRGNAGGYILALPPTEVTVADVINAAQGPISVAGTQGVRSSSNDYLCGDSAFAEFWKTVDESMAQVCQKTTLVSLTMWEEATGQMSVPDYAI